MSGVPYGSNVSPRWSLGNLIIGGVSGEGDVVKEVKGKKTTYKLAGRVYVTKPKPRMEPYVCTGARPWERQLSPAAGPTRLARASVVRGGFSVSSTSETGLVYRGRSTCVTSSCGCSTSSNSSSLSPLRSSSDIFPAVSVNVEGCGRAVGSYASSMFECYR